MEGMDNLIVLLIGLIIGMIVLYIVSLDYIFLNTGRPGHQVLTGGGCPMTGGGPVTDFFVWLMDFLRNHWLTR